MFARFSRRTTSHDEKEKIVVWESRKVEKLILTLMVGLVAESSSAGFKNVNVIYSNQTP